MEKDIRRATILVVGTLILSGCGFIGGINTAQKLATALKNKGVVFQSIVKLSNKPTRSPRTGEEFKINEAIDLKGDGIYVEIMRINNRQTFQKFTPVLEISLAMIETVYKRQPGSIPAYLKYPFVVVVIEEPSEGQIKKALKEIFLREPIQEVIASEEGYKILEQLKSQIKAIFQ